MEIEDKIARILSAMTALPTRPRRKLIALAGPPASGKSTLAQALQQRLGDLGRPCGLLAMDGFHLDNPVLDRRGLVARKGAPETFDLAGFRSLLARLPQEDEVVTPVFDRVLDRAIAGADVITRDHRVVIVEGNYLLLDEPGWRDLGRVWDLSVFLPDDLETLERRLVARWIAHGHDAPSARARALGNDIPNARRVLDHRLASDLDLPGA
ncbi:MAG: AAA family ATPase [Marinibacterium sp.]|nr:AAA family ATPase [Marinibacterium sp.]